MSNLNSITLQSMKCDSFEDAYSHSIPIMLSENESIGMLVPVGNWILLEDKKIELISQWRQQNIEMFLSQFSVTFNGTKRYLNETSIQNIDRILFLIYNSENEFIGHSGIIIKDEVVELDNVMRGIKRGHPLLMQKAEISILKWCFPHLRLSSSILHVLSYNFAAIRLYENIGYRQQEEFYLKKKDDTGILSHEVLSSADRSNVDYKYIKMRLIHFI